MAKFTLIREDSTYYNNSKSTSEFSAVTLENVIEEFEMFLKGCGFVFDGHLGVVQEYYDTYTDVNKDINDYHIYEHEEIDIRN